MLNQLDALQLAKRRAAELQGTDRGVCVIKRWSRDGSVGFIVHEFQVSDRDTWKWTRPRLEAR
jgi:hypothetical protein